MRIKITYGPGGRKRFFVDGKEVTERQFRKAGNRFRVEDFLGSTVGGTRPDTWPKTSLALACHPEQVGEMNAALEKRGIGTRYDADGTPHIPDRADFNRLMRFNKAFDRDSFY